jgi:hypothetical protein
VSVYTLSFHADYACRHSGACCTAGWSIPVEPRLVPILGVELLVPDARGTCVNFDRNSRLCVVQREHGEDMLPGSCYQFPRRALIDDRGTFVTLSNFCPTAATLLCASAAPLAIVCSPAAFPESRVYEGLDARGQWPPLVRPGLLFDLGSYSRWEQFVVSTLADGGPPDTALARIGAAAEALRTWTPQCGSFDAWVTRSLSAASTDAAALLMYERLRTVGAYQTLRRFVPEGLTAPPSLSADLDVVDAGLRPHEQVVRRYLAAKAFASWSAYQGRGLRTMVAELIVAEFVLRVECERARLAARRALDRPLLIEAIRQSDLFLVHLIDRPSMVEWLGEIETITTPLCP